MQTKETMMRVKPFAITLDVGTSLANRTGSWRTLKPVYVDRLPPCNAKCPAGEQCQAWLFHAQSGNYENAWKQIIEDNPFPAVMGRVCYHTCQGACNRNGIDEPVGINAVERFLGDYALEKDWQPAGSCSRYRQAHFDCGGGACGPFCRVSVASPWSCCACSRKC